METLGRLGKAEMALRPFGRCCHRRELHSNVAPIKARGMQIKSNQIGSQRDKTYVRLPVCETTFQLAQNTNKLLDEAGGLGGEMVSYSRQN